MPAPQCVIENSGVNLEDDVVYPGGLVMMLYKLVPVSRRLWMTLCNDDIIAVGLLAPLEDHFLLPEFHKKILSERGNCNPKMATTHQTSLQVSQALGYPWVVFGCLFRKAAVVVSFGRAEIPGLGPGGGGVVFSQPRVRHSCLVVFQSLQ